jgi:hypothetical protein
MPLLPHCGAVHPRWSPSPPPLQCLSSLIAAPLLLQGKCLSPLASLAQVPLLYHYCLSSIIVTVVPLPPHPSAYPPGLLHSLPHYIVSPLSLRCLASLTASASPRSLHPLSLLTNVPLLPQYSATPPSSALPVLTPYAASAFSSQCLLL